MANSRLTDTDRQQRRRRRALNKQARRREKRREKIFSGLSNLLIAVMIEHALGGPSGGNGVPLMFVPTRQLRRRVADLNEEIDALYLQPEQSENAGEPAHQAAAVPPGAVLDVRPATRVPRRRGRAPTLVSYPLLPMMPDQKNTLDDILQFPCRYPSETGLGRRHRCRCCPKLPEFGGDIERRDLHVYPTAAGDLVFRCHRCGWSLDSVEFVKQAFRLQTLTEAADWLTARGHITTAISEARLAGYARLEELRRVFEEGRRRFNFDPPGGPERVIFGDWALLSTSRLRELFSQYRLPAELPAECLGRIGRDVFGRWSALHLHQPRSYGAYYRLELRDWEPPAPWTCFLPRWADFMEGRELILCSELRVAMDVEAAVRRWPGAEGLPVALIDRCTGTIGEPVLPFARVWAMPLGSRSARFALPFCAPADVGVESRVRVRRWPERVSCPLPPVEAVASRSLFCDPATAHECVEDLAAMIAQEQDHQPLPIVLADTLSQPGLHPDTRRRLLQKVRARTGTTPEALVPEGFKAWTGGPHALNAPGGTTYIARHGSYWRRGRREKEFTPVSNFVLHLLADRINAKGRITHDACLEVAGKRVEISLSPAVFASSKRLLTALTTAAISAAMDYPIIADAKAKRLLSELIKATQARPQPSNAPSAW